MHTLTILYIYIYIYMCVCVCVCVGLDNKLYKMHCTRCTVQYALYKMHCTICTVQDALYVRKKEPYHIASRNVMLRYVRVRLLSVIFQLPNYVIT